MMRSRFRLSPKAALLLIAAIFVLPLLAARLMLTGAIDYTPGSFRNYGDLVQPPVSVDWNSHSFNAPSVLDQSNKEIQLPDRHHWTVLHVVPPACTAACIATITSLRQVHRALGRDLSRVRVTLLLPGSMQSGSVREMKEIYPDFQLLENPGGAVEKILQEVSSLFSASATGSSYLIDPIGNIMMYYPAETDPNNLKKDLKRLLTWSKLDK